MMKNSQDPFPPELTALLELERRSHPTDEKLKAEVLDHLEMAIALAGPAGGGPAMPDAAPHAPNAVSNAAPSAIPHAAVKAGASVGAKKLIGVGLAALAVGGAAGSASTAVLLQRSEPPVATPVLTASRLPPSAPVVDMGASAPSSDGGSDTALPPTVPVAPRTTAPASSVAATRGDLAKERELLDVARAAIARGRPEDAIAAAKEHARKWPRGYLEEEREVILIQALAAIGKHQEAEARATRFRNTFPRSMLMPVVDAALGGSP
jgi:hypothetical protein